MSLLLFETPLGKRRLLQVVDRQEPDGEERGTGIGPLGLLAPLLKLAPANDDPYRADS
jgi:hypothetical protein